MFAHVRESNGVAVTGAKRNLRLSAGRLSVLVALVVLSGILAVASPYFLSLGNLTTVALQVSDLGLVALGQTFAIISGGIDLSVGQVSALTGVTAALVMKAVGVPCGILVGLSVAVLFGLINGLLVAKARLHPFIVTLGMGGVARGISLVMTAGLPVSSLPKAFFAIGGGSVFGFLPSGVIVFLAFATISAFILNNTRIGRYTYAMGSNAEATRLAGVNTGKYRIVVHVMCSFCAGIAGLLITSRLVSAQPTGGVGYDINSIAAVILGGGSLLGGEGTVVGTLVGTFFMGILRNGLNLLNISVFWQEIVIGAVLLTAVLYDQFRRGMTTE